MMQSSMAGQTQNQNQTPNMDQFELYFRRADLDQDGRISGAEAVSFFKGSNLPQQVLAQIWTHADRNRTGFLGRAEFFNALKLVTVAQNKRELTPDIVKAALFGPASAKIPAPQINLAAVPAPHSNANMGPPSVGAPSVGLPSVPSSGSAPTASQGMGIRGPQGFPSQQNQFMRPPRPPAPAAGFSPQQGGVGQVMPRGGTVVASRPPTSNMSNDWLGVSTAGPPSAVTSNVPTSGVSPSTALDGFGLATSGLTSSTPPRPRATTGLTQHVPPKPSDPNQAVTKDSNMAVSGNGFVSNSLFGDVFSATPSQPKQNPPVPVPSAGVVPVTSANVPAAPAAGGIQQPSNVALQSSLTQQPSQSQQVYSTLRQNQQASVQSFSAVPGGGANSASGQSQLSWPRMTQTDVQKYSKVFMEVDTDRDGKITGEQARNLFLSWRLPREVLKQVWDLSDQDNDSMLSLREFCIALYLMERHREGRSLPRVLPPGIMFEEIPSPSSGQPGAAYGNSAWRPTSGPQQPHRMPGPRPVTAAAGARPPRPVPIPPPDEDMQPRQQKPRVPVLEKHLVDQLSTEEQNSLNLKFQEATEADKKVSELEKEILESKEKIEYYRTKMQELILYKSRCDNRLNEITERVSADKREVDTLAKKYEDKYKQSGDVASKLTIEEATFRDIQEKKMELYRAIVKLEQDGNADNIQGRVDRIQGDLEEQVKALNERCKMYGLRAKPTSLLELPFGWQPGIQEGAADWDENWDKFEDEGFTFVKELTLDVQNVIAPPKPKSVGVQNKASSPDEGATAVSSSNGDVKSENLPVAGNRASEDEASNVHSKEGLERSLPDSPASRKALDSPSREVGGQSKDIFERTPPDSPASRKAVDSPSKKFDDYPSGKFDGDSSPQAVETQREHGDAESVFSGDKSYDEAGWGTYDSHYDANAGWDINPVKMKEKDHETYNESSFFGSDDWGLNPIRTEVPKKSTFVFDSVPGTPALSYAGSPHGDNNLFPKRSPLAFADSVPGTPAYSYAGSPRGDNTFQNRSPFAFVDSVPSTPLYNTSNSPRRFSDGPEDHSFNTFSRFDSFSSTHDSGLFQPRESFSRFDSMGSTRDSEYDQGFYPPQGSLTRFDSMRSTADSDFGNSLFPPRDSTFTRFDSMRSTRDSSDFGHGFASFDDSADPFGSSDPFKTPDPFKTSAETPRRDSDSWRAF